MRTHSNLLRLPLLLFCLAVLAGCGSVSGLTREQTTAPARIADFSRVEVVDFTASDASQFDDAKKAEEHAKNLAEAQKAFADKIADEIRATGAFAEVGREPGTRPALRVSGDISRYDEGNIVARGLTGFAGQTHFDASIDVADADSGRSLATLTVDRNSWPLPVGASLSTLQTTNFFMNNAARKIAEELAAKKGVVSKND
ncbi:MAG: DUF4410 domain-containing protein [Arenimonas sp.]